MLRSKYLNQAFKKLPVPLLCEGSNEVVEVEVTNPQSGECLGKRYEEISTVKQISEESAVCNESADLYSIENMQSVGLNPVVCPTAGFIFNGLGAIEKVESSANQILSNLPEKDNNNAE